MKTLKRICILAAATIMGCTGDFEEINTNLNEPEVVSANLLLSTAISNGVNEVVDQAWNNGNIVAQLTAKINFTDFDRYNWDAEEDFWEGMYENITIAEEIIEIATDELDPNTSYQGMALVLKSWMYAQLTDCWGDVPYSEAISGETDDNFSPAYDAQEDIYAGILSDLATADGLLAQSQDILGGDVLFDGDLTQWRKLANSLRLRYLMRISNVQDVTSDMQAIVNEGVIMESNDDNAVMAYPASSTVDSWPVSTDRIGSFDEHRMSTTSESVLKSFNDLRMDAWFQPTDNVDDDPTLFTGLPNGLSEDKAADYYGDGTPSLVSRLNQAFFFDSPNLVEAPIMKYSEVQFILAEAAQRGLINGDAETYYNAGVVASHEYWNSGQDTDEYLEQEGVAYDGELETIITQKWLASFLVGMEGWFDFRRTGYPSVIVPGQDNVNGDVVPVRFFYPDSEQTLNADNYASAVNAMGGSDNINTGGWWESN